MRKIKTINARDIDFLNALRISGVCCKQQALHKGFLTSNRLKTFELNHVIERCRDVYRLEIYRFTDKGKSWVTKNIPELADRSFYRSNSYQHDMALFDRYIQLSATERATVLCEAEIRNTFREHLENLREQDVSRYNKLSEQLQTHEVSTPDMYYVRDDGCKIYFEATTSAYSFFECSAKEAFALEMGGTPIEFIKI